MVKVCEQCLLCFFRHLLPCEKSKQQLQATLPDALQRKQQRSQPLPPLAYFCTCTLVKKISQQAPHNRLVGDDEDVALSFQLHNYRLQALDQVLVGLENKMGIFQGVW